MIEIGFKRKPDGGLASPVDFAVLNRRVETEEQAFALARLFSVADEAIECLRHAEAQARVDASTAQSAAQVENREANLGLARERQRWADIFHEVIRRATGRES